MAMRFSLVAFLCIVTAIIGAFSQMLLPGGEGLRGIARGDESAAVPIDDFVPGPLPVIKSSLSVPDPEIYWNTASVAIVGTVSPAIHGNVRADFFHVEGIVRTRMMAVEIPIESDGQFRLTVSPHEAGWFDGSMVVALSLPQLAQVREENWIWITSDEKLPKGFQPPFPLERESPVEYTRIHLTPDQPPAAGVVLKGRIPFSVCGRFTAEDKGLEEHARKLIITVKRGRVTTAAGAALAMRDGEEWWFEWLGPVKGLPPGEYIASAKLAGGKDQKPLVEGFHFKVVADE